MANTNFTVHNGLTVGPLTIDAATGSITTSGTISSTGIGAEIFNGNIFANSGTISTSTTTGALIVSGGAGISGNVYVGGNLQVSGTTTIVNTEYVTATEYANKLLANGGVASTTTTTGDIQTTGGMGIAGAINVGGGLNLHGNAYITTNQTTATLLDATATTINAFRAATAINIGYASTTLTLTGKMVPGANVTYDLGSTTANWNNVYAVNFAGTSTTAKYADLAECYAGDCDYNPGTVLDFGGTNEVTISSQDSSSFVAGVVSTNPAHLMNSAINADYPIAVALTGRVPCKVAGPVRKGQMMVSAGNGFARAETTPSMGSVIGKAIENNEDGEAIIEIVVGRL